jgi:hypothetical protein
VEGLVVLLVLEELVVHLELLVIRFVQFDLSNLL